MEITRPLPARQNHDMHFRGQKSQIEVEDSHKWYNFKLLMDISKSRIVNRAEQKGKMYLPIIVSSLQLNTTKHCRTYLQQYKQHVCSITDLSITTTIAHD